MLPECMQSTSSCEIKLRELEIDSYSKILSVFRARGNLTNDRRKLLKQIGSFLNISQERHRAEVRRVANDELLSSIAHRVTGGDWTVEWHEEGRRLPPTPTPSCHLTVNTPFADYIASVASLGTNYIHLYNKHIGGGVVNGEVGVEKEEGGREKWVGDVERVLCCVGDSKRRWRDVSVQTSAKRPAPTRCCTYCQRRKTRLQTRQRLHQPSPPPPPTPSSSSSNSGSNVLQLPSGSQIVVENAFTTTTSSDDLCVSIIAQEVVVETEPVVGPSCSWQQPADTAQQPHSAAADITSPPLHHMFTKVWDETDKHLPPRIPRILNSGPRKKLKKGAGSAAIAATVTATATASLATGVRKKGPDLYRETSPHETACTLVGSTQAAPLRYTKPGHIQVTASQPCPGTSGRHQGRAKQRHHQVVSTLHDEPSRLVEPPDSVSRRHRLPKQREGVTKPPGGIYKHYVRVRHTPKAVRPYQEAVQIPLEYLHTRQDLLDSSSAVRVVDINDLKTETSAAQSVCVGSLDTVLHDPLQPTDTLIQGILLPHSLPSDGRSVGAEQDIVASPSLSPPSKIIKIFNGEKRLHGTIHLRTDHIKDMINRLPTSQFSQVQVNQPGPDSPAPHTLVWDGANLSAGEFIMEDVSIVDETSYPLVNGHEEILLQEQVLAASESLVEKSELCLMPQTDMKFSVVDLCDYSAPLDHLSQSKEDSRDSDVVINRP